MSDVLSPEEIAALVEAAREGTLPEPAARASTRPAKRVREVDFTRPTKFTQEQQRRISRGHQAFCRTAQTQLSAELGVPVELEVLNVDQQTWVAAMQEIPQPSLYAVVTTAAGAPLLVGLEHSAVMTMIERMLGGTAESRPPERELTEVEVALARRLFVTLVTQLSRTWQELFETELALGGIETQLVNTQLVSQSEPTLALTMEVQLGRSSSTMTLLVPYRSIEPMLEQLSRGHYDSHESGPDEDVERMVQAALRSVAVEIRAEVGSRDLTVDEVLALRPGDVLRLGPSAAGGTVYADAVPIYRVRPGRSGQWRAVSVLDVAEAPE